MRRLVCTFVVRKSPKSGFLISWLIFAADFFQYQLFQTNISGILDITQSIRMSNNLDPNQENVGPDLGPTVCKGYQQTAKMAASKEN